MEKKGNEHPPLYGEEEDSQELPPLSEEEEESILMETDEAVPKGQAGEDKGADAPSNSHDVDTSKKVEDKKSPSAQKEGKERKKRKNRPGAVQRRRRKEKQQQAIGARASPAGTPQGSVSHTGSVIFPTLSTPTSKPKGLLLKRGILIPSASESSEKPAQDGEKGKRPRSTPASEERRPAKRPSYRDVVQGEIKLQVVYSADGKGRITPTDYAALNQGLRSAIDKLDGSFCVKIAGVGTRGPHVVIRCHDAATRLWLESEVPKISEGKMKVIDYEDVPLDCKVNVWVREPSPPIAQEIFTKISKQNGGLDTSNWLLVHSFRAGPGFVMVIRMDQSSWKVIQPPHKVYYYTDLLDFDLEKSKGNQDGASSASNA